uniref:Class I SAM-dependent methyltransferase n=1 Tax=Plectus sambesii TaxID=2011161 RepID=A0A914WZV0_9BILA
MARICRRLAEPRKCTVLSVDTWLGAPIVYTDTNAIIHTELSDGNGNLKLFEKFLKNMILSNVSDIVTPLRLPSLGAAHVLNCFKIKADMIYIDGDHEYEGVKADLAAYYPIVKKGGLFFGDDAENVDVRRAVREMVAALSGQLQWAENRKDRATWLTWKLL